MHLHELLRMDQALNRMRLVESIAAEVPRILRGITAVVFYVCVGSL